MASKKKVSKARKRTRALLPDDVTKRRAVETLLLRWRSVEHYRRILLDHVRPNWTRLPSETDEVYRLRVEVANAARIYESAEAIERLAVLDAALFEHAQNSRGGSKIDAILDSAELPAEATVLRAFFDVYTALESAYPDESEDRLILAAANETQQQHGDLSSLFAHWDAGPLARTAPRSAMMQRVGFIPVMQYGEVPSKDGAKRTPLLILKMDGKEKAVQAAIALLRGASPRTIQRRFSSRDQRR